MSFNFFPQGVNKAENNHRIRTPLAGDAPLENRVQAEMDALQAAFRNLDAIAAKQSASRTAEGEASFVGGQAFISGASTNALGALKDIFAQAAFRKESHTRG